MLFSSGDVPYLDLDVPSGRNEIIKDDAPYNFRELTSKGGCRLIALQRVQALCRNHDLAAPSEPRSEVQLANNEVIAALASTENDIVFLEIIKKGFAAERLALKSFLS